MEGFLKRLAIKSYKTVKVLGYILFSIEFPELINMIFKTDTLGDGAIITSLIAFGLLAIYSDKFKQEGYE